MNTHKKTLKNAKKRIEKHIQRIDTFIQMHGTIYLFVLSLLFLRVVISEEHEFQYFGQYLQDGVLHLAFFTNFRQGFFVEVGAADGITFSNTLFFERSLEWNGINIEPHKPNFDKLVVNRPNCINLNVAIDKENNENEFLENSGYTTLLSGMVKHFHPDHLQRLYLESLADGVMSKVVKVFTRTLQSIFHEYDVTRIHLLSIDIEGGELAAIQSIDFSKVYIDIIIFEAQHEDAKRIMIDYLMTNLGYYHVTLDSFYTTKPDSMVDVFMIHKDSPFTKSRPVNYI